MATRSGDLDPGVLLYLLRMKKMNADSLEELLNQDSGLKALSDGTPDMRNLQQAAEAGDDKARLAIEVFCTSIRKIVAAYAAVLGGLDMIVFSGGIGEHSALVRSKVCAGLEFLGVPTGSHPEESQELTAATDQGHVKVCIVASKEDLQIARHCRALMKNSG
jgi:acetate kinase